MLFKWLMATVYLTPLILLVKHTPAVKHARSILCRCIGRGGHPEEEEQQPEPGTEEPARRELKLDSIQGNVLTYVF